MSKLTKRQSEIITFIESFIGQQGRPPMLKEIAAGIGITSKSVVHTHLCKLRDKELVDWNDGEIGTIRLIKSEEDEHET
ncbi:MAG: LexA repressor [Bacillota bacterium]